jgi:hypothetical protein
MRFQTAAINSSLARVCTKFHIFVFSRRSAKPKRSYAAGPTSGLLVILTPLSLSHTHKHTGKVCMMYIAARSRNQCCTGKATAHFAFSSALSHKRHDFEKKKKLTVKCFSVFPTTFLRIISRSKQNLAMYYHKCALVFT